MADSPPVTTNQGSLYEQFGVASTISHQELKRVYRKLAFTYHPDRNAGNSSRMQQLNRAWFVLSDPDRRFKYDQSLKLPLTSDPAEKQPPPRGAHRMPARVPRYRSVQLMNAFFRLTAAATRI